MGFSAMRKAEAYGRSETFNYTRFHATMAREGWILTAPLLAKPAATQSCMVSAWLLQSLHLPAGLHSTDW